MASSLFLGSGAVFSLTVKRAFFSSWRGSAGLVVTLLVGACWALVLGQLLGAVGALRMAPLLAVSVGSAAATVLALQQLGGGDYPPSEALEVEEPPPAQARSTVLIVATVLLVLLVAAIWVARTAIAVRRGINDPDSLGYHLPFSATFAQTGFADQNRFVLPLLPVQFYPANDELLSALALVLTKSMAFAAVKNLLFGGLVLLAAHAVGKAFKAEALAVGAAAVVLGLPVIAFSQPGEAVNDVFVVFILVGAVALLAHARDQPAPYVLVLACTGAAYGTKLSAIAPSAALGGFALFLLATRVRTHRWRAATIGAASSLVVGGSWYLRNALRYGSPIPPAHIGIGPLELRQIKTDALKYSYSVAWYLVRGRALGQFWNGLGRALGPLFLIVLLAVLGAIIVSLWSGKGFKRGLAVLAVAMVIGYLTTPASAYGAEGNPEAFVINVHYAAPALMFGMLTVALCLAQRPWAAALPVLSLAVVALGIPAGQRIPFWAPEIGGRSFALLVAASVASGAVAWMSLRPSMVRWVPAGASVAVVVATIGVALIVRQQPRYSETEPLRRWAASARPTRVAGWVPEVALLYGPGVPNKVVTLTRIVDGAPIPLDSCPAWMQALRDGRFPFTGVIPGTQWQRWLQADPAFELVAEQQGHGAIYRVVGQPDVRCPGAG